jgi:hypothetical protein
MFCLLAGMQSSFDIFVRDLVYHALTEDIPFSVDLVKVDGSLVLSPRLRSVPSLSIISCLYEVTVSGSYFMMIKNKGQLISDGKFQLTVLPSFAFRDAHFFLNQRNSRLLIAGEVHSFETNLRDAWWNRIQLSSPIFGFSRRTDSVSAHRDVACLISTNPPSTAQVTVALTVAGIYAISLKSQIGIGLAATYFLDPFFLFPVLSRQENDVDFSRQPSEPIVSAFPYSPSFSIRWAGLIRPRYSRVHTFSCVTRSPSERTKLWIDNILVIDQWSSLNSSQSMGTISFPTANAAYDLLIEYKQMNATHFSGLQLLWSEAETSRSAVPSTRLIVVQDFSGTYNVEVSPSSVCSSTSFLSVNQTTLTVGKIVSFTISARDSFSNPVNVTLAGALSLYVGGEEINTRFTPGVVGVWYTQLLVTVCGLYSINIKVVNIPFVQATYYSDFAMGSPILSSLEPSINVDWGLTGPSSFSTDFFSARWAGKIRVNITGFYTFLLIADDCATFFLAGRRMLDSCLHSVGVHCRGCVAYPGQGRYIHVELHESETYFFEVHHFETTGASLCKLLFSKADGVAELVGHGVVSSDFSLVDTAIQISVWSDAVAKRGCQYLGDVSTIATSGLTTSFIVICRDSFGNLFSTDSISTSPRLLGFFRVQGIRNIQFDWIFEGSGKFLGSVAPFQVGTYAMQVYNLVPGSHGLATTYYDSSCCFFGNQARYHVEAEPSGLRVFGPELSSFSLSHTNDFGMRWSGMLLSSVVGQYTFFSSHNLADRVKLWVDNQKVIDCWSIISNNISGIIYLESARYYEITLELGKASSDGSIDLQWKFGSGSLVTIPSRNMYATVDALRVDPAILQVIAGDVCSEQSTASGSGLTISTVSTPALFTIRSRDAAGNIQTKPDLNLVVRIESSVGPRLQFHFSNTQHKGVYAINYTLQSQLSYWIHASFVKVGGLRATYYGNNSWAMPHHVRVDDSIDFSSANALFPWLLTPTFHARWSGFLRPTHFQQYSLTSEIKVATERLRLWVDNVLILDQWTSLDGIVRSGTVQFSMGKQYYDLLLEYKNTNLSGPSALYLSWASNGPFTVPLAKIPKSSYLTREDIAGSPFSARCYHCTNCICLASTSVTGSALSIMTAGLVNYFRVYPKDSVGNQLQLSNHEIYANAVSLLSIDDDPDGVQSALRLPFDCFGQICATEQGDLKGWIVTKSGLYFISVFSVRAGGLWATYYSDYDLIEPSNSFLSQKLSLSPSIRFLSVKMSGFVRPNVTEFFTIYSRFLCGNRARASQYFYFMLAIDSDVILNERILCQSALTSEVSARVRLFAGALHEFLILLQRSDFDHDVDVTWASFSIPRSPITNFYHSFGHLNGSPFRSIAVSGSTCASLTTSSGISVLTAGNPTIFRIHAHDEFGNLKGMNARDFLFFNAVSGRRNSQAILGLENSQITASLTVTRAGLSQLVGFVVGAQGLSATYFATNDFIGASSLQTAINIDFCQQQNSLCHVYDRFSVRWSGLLVPRSLSKVRCIGILMKKTPAHPQLSHD